MKEYGYRQKIRIIAKKILQENFEKTFYDPEEKEGKFSCLGDSIENEVNEIISSGRQKANVDRKKIIGNTLFKKYYLLQTMQELKKDVLRILQITDIRGDVVQIGTAVTDANLYKLQQEYNNTIIVIDEAPHLTNNEDKKKKSQRRAAGGGGGGGGGEEEEEEGGGGEEEEEEDEEEGGGGEEEAQLEDIEKDADHDERIDEKLQRQVNENMSSYRTLYYKCSMYQLMMFLTYHVSGLKLIFLSGTPILDHAKSIVLLLNMLRQNVNLKPKTPNEIFDRKHVNKEEFINFSRGLISFVRGENPYTYPYQFYPLKFENNHEEPHPKWMSLKYYVKENQPCPEIYTNNLDLYITFPNKELLKKLNGNITLESYYHVEISKTMVLYNVQPAVDRRVGDIRKVYGVEEKLFLQNDKYLNLAIENPRKTFFRNFSDFKPGSPIKEFNGFDINFFGMENICNFSAKIPSIITNVDEGDGICMVYSQWKYYGVFPLALSFEEYGYNLFWKKLGDGESMFSNNILEKNRRERENDKHKNYAIITGDTSTVKRGEIFKIFSSPENKNGNLIKVLLITRASFEGVDLKNVRQLHVMEPYYNLQHLEQLIGRTARTRSHFELDPKDRNVQIFLHATMNEKYPNQIYSDVKSYNYAYKKAIITYEVTRLMKQNAFDCGIHIQQQDFLHKKGKSRIEMTTSLKKQILVEVGDVNGSLFCDMQNCKYTCIPEGIVEEYTLSNFTDYTLQQREIQYQIKELFKKRYFFKLSQIIAKLTLTKKLSESDVYYILNDMVENKYIIHDQLEHPGYIHNIGEYYIFLPIEFKFSHPQKRITLFNIKPRLVDDPPIEITLEIPKKSADEAMNSMFKIFDSINMKLRSSKPGKDLIDYICTSLIRMYGDGVGVDMTLQVKMLMDTILSEYCFDREAEYKFKILSEKGIISGNTIPRTKDGTVLRDFIIAKRQECIDDGYLCFKSFEYIEGLRSANLSKFIPENIDFKKILDNVVDCNGNVASHEQIVQFCEKTPYLYLHHRIGGSDHTDTERKWQATRIGLNISPTFFLMYVQQDENNIALKFKTTLNGPETYASSKDLGNNIEKANIPTMHLVYGSVENSLTNMFDRDRKILQLWNEFKESAPSQEIKILVLELIARIISKFYPESKLGGGPRNTPFDRTISFLSMEEFIIKHIYEVSDTHNGVTVQVPKKQTKKLKKK